MPSVFDADFDTFSRAVRGRPALPWQNRLADLVLSQGWPSEIGVPTGLGKSTTIDIAVWSLAREASTPPAKRRLPTRVWYVVNRRLLVDAASDQTETLRTLLSDPSAVADPALSNVVAQASAALASRSGLSDSGGPLFLSRLRGAAPAGHRAPHPSKPAVMCTTVPMYASRLLFRGYGLSAGMWPIDAAHAATDSLVLLDEAHLSAELIQLMGRLPDCDARRAGIMRLPGRFTRPDSPELLPPSRIHPVMVSLTATGSRHHDRFDLDADDLAHPIVTKRLSAAKRTSVHVTTRDRVAGDLADACLNLLHEVPEARSALVFVNTPRRAREVRRALERKPTKGQRGRSVLVLTGQLRDLDADAIRTRLLDPHVGIPSGRATEPQTVLIVIATQTLEVGADVDADVLVSELAGSRAVVQRLGRLNRLGDRPWARASLWFVGDEESPLYGTEPSAVHDRLAMALAADGSVDLGPAHIRTVIGDATDSAPDTPELLPAHLWEWAKTSLLEPGAAPPEPFFAGRPERDRSVELMWRSTLTVGEELAPPPSDRETVDVPLHEARDFLEQLQIDWGIIDPYSSTLQPGTVAALRPGTRVVLPVEAGGYHPLSGWDPEHQAGSVRDLSPIIRGSLMLSPGSWHNLAGRPLTTDERTLLTAVIDPDIEIEDQDRQRLFTSLCEMVRTNGDERQADSDGLLAEDWSSLRRSKATLAMSAAGPQVVWRLPPGRTPQVRVDFFDELSAAPTELIGLHEHLQSVGATARRIAEDLGLPTALVDAIETAGRFHDLGKADARFQDVLGNDSDHPLAKSTGGLAEMQRRQRVAAWPTGSRHELLSVQLVDAAIEAGYVVDNADLIRHLVISHHGRGRPWCPSPAGSVDLPTAFNLDGQVFAAATNPSRPDWMQPERFRRLNEQYGYWGLALLETIVRQADHVVSEITEVL